MKKIKKSVLNDSFIKANKEMQTCLSYSDGTKVKEKAFNKAYTQANITSQMYDDYILQGQEPIKSKRDLTLHESLLHNIEQYKRLHGAMMEYYHRTRLSK